MAFLTFLLSRLTEIFSSPKSRPHQESFPSFRSIESKNYRPMDFEQKYTEGDDIMYGADELFLDKLHDMSRAQGVAIMKKISKHSHLFDVLSDFPQFMSSYVRRYDNTDFFFRFEFLRDNDYLLLIDIQEIDSDTYLDDFTEKNTLENASGDGRPTEDC